MRLDVGASTTSTSTTGTRRREVDESTDEGERSAIQATTTTIVEHARVFPLDDEDNSILYSNEHVALVSGLFFSSRDHLL